MPRLHYSQLDMESGDLMGDGGVETTLASGDERRLLLQLRSDRRLGHEWDDWDGEGLPGGGEFAAGSSLFFGVAALGTLLLVAGLTGLGWLLAPRMERIWEELPAVAIAFTVGLGIVAFGWLLALAVVIRTKRNWLPPKLAEAGLFPWVMPRVEAIGRRVGVSRDRLGNAMLRVYNGLAAARGRGAIAADDLLILLPRCLSRDAMREAMAVSTRYGVPIFVAARGRYARQMIALRKPRAVVAVACERDLVSGVHDVAARLPVLGTTLTLPDGPCRNTELAVGDLELRVRQFLGIG